MHIHNAVPKSNYRSVGASTVVSTKELKRVPLKYMAFSTHSLEITSLVLKTGIYRKGNHALHTSVFSSNFTTLRLDSSCKGKVFPPLRSLRSEH